MDKGTKRAIKQLKGPDGRSFAHRLENLIEINNITANALARNTGIPQSAISNYLKPCKDIDCENGRLPDCATIRVLANYFSVSADYLLGITRDPNIKKSAVDELGLPPETVNFLHDLAEKRKSGKILDYSFVNTLYVFLSLIDSTDGLMLFHAMKRYIDAVQAQKIINEIAEKQDPLWELHGKEIRSVYSQNDILNMKPEKDLYHAIEERINTNIDPEGVRYVLRAHCQLADRDSKKELLAYLSGFKISDIVKNDVYDSLTKVLEVMANKSASSESLGGNYGND